MKKVFDGIGVLGTHDKVSHLASGRSDSSRRPQWHGDDLEPPLTLRELHSRLDRHLSEVPEAENDPVVIISGFSEDPPYGLDGVAFGPGLVLLERSDEWSIET